MHFDKDPVLARAVVKAPKFHLMLSVTHIILVPFDICFTLSLEPAPCPSLCGPLDPSLSSFGSLLSTPVAPSSFVDSVSYSLYI